VKSPARRLNVLGAAMILSSPRPQPCVEIVIKFLLLNAMVNKSGAVEGMSTLVVLTSSRG
jgi:hypothetical protein